MFICLPFWSNTKSAFSRIIILSTSFYNIKLYFKKSLTYFGVQALCSRERFVWLPTFLLSILSQLKKARCVTGIKYSENNVERKCIAVQNTKDLSVEGRPNFVPN